MAKRRKSVLDKFPPHLEPRPLQKSALEKIEASWSSSDVFVANLPTGSGKSAIATTLMRWAGKAIVLAPNKLLVNQYKSEYKSLHVLHGKSDHTCTNYGRTLDKRPVVKKQKTCPKSIGCPGCDAYREELRRAYIFPYLLCNNYVYLAHRPRLYRETLIIDEAHLFIDALKMLYEKKIWWGTDATKGQLEFPTSAVTYRDLESWVSKPEVQRRYQNTPKFKLLVQELYENKHVISPKYDEESDRYYIHMTPVDLRKFPPIAWPAGIKKIVLLSATISRKDLEQMGLGDRRITYVNASSPIEAERRPIYFTEHVNMSLRHQEANLPKLVELITEIAEGRTDKRGLIHAPYNLAPAIYSNLPPNVRQRVLTHTRENKSRIYKQFKSSDPGTILLASGMYEGIDLPEDACRWQVVAKCPWSYLGDPAVKYLSDEDPEWYAWQCIKTVIQASGRVVRGTRDFGETFLLDSSFKNLYTGKYTSLFPQWFLDAIHT